MSVPRSSVTTMTTDQALEHDEADVEEHPSGLTDLERDILNLERSWWKHPAVKETTVRERWDMSPTRYYQLLGALIDRPEALAYDPMVVRRLQRLRDARRSQRKYGDRLGS